MDMQIDKRDAQGYPVPASVSHLPSTDRRQPLPDYEDSLNLNDYLEPLIRRKWMILAFLALVLIPTLVFNLMKAPVFTARGFVELSPSTPRVTKFEEVVSTKSGTEEFVETQNELLRSNALARRVIEKLHLAQHPIFNAVSTEEGAEAEEGFKLKDMLASIKETIKSWIPFKKGEQEAAEIDMELAQLKMQKNMEKFITDNLDVQRQGYTSIRSIAFSSVDPMLSRDVVNTLIREFMNWQMDMKVDSAKAAKQQLEKQIRVARTQLEKSEESLNQFAKQAGIISPNSSQLNLVHQQLEEINKALARAETERIAKMELYDQAKLDDVASLPQVLQSQLIQSLRQQHITLMAEYEQLRATFKDNYPLVKSLKARIRDIGQKIDTEQKRILGSLKTDYATVASVEKVLQSTAEEKKALVLEYNDLASHYNILDREVEINKQIYQSLLERSKEIDANVSTDLGNIKVVDFASLPLKPDQANLYRNVFLAVVFGLMGGIGLVLFMEYVNNAVKRVDELSDQYGIPVLGVVPLVQRKEARKIDSLVWINPLSSFSEAIRMTKISTKLSISKNDHKIKSLLITSIDPNEGKSTIASNLAQAFALSDEKVLLIDADLRRPSLHKVFCRGGFSKGLIHYLQGIYPLEDVLQKTEVPNLYFISSGGVLHNPTELLNSTRMRKLMEALSDHFDVIVMDGPPFSSDALVLSNQVDGVILIATLGRTHREGIRIFRRNLSYVRGQILGSIINKLNMNHYCGDYYYKHYRNYHSTYAQGKKNLPVQVHANY